MTKQINIDEFTDKISQLAHILTDNHITDLLGFAKSRVALPEHKVAMIDEAIDLAEDIDQEYKTYQKMKRAKERNRHRYIAKTMENKAW